MRVVFELIGLTFHRFIVLQHDLYDSSVIMGAGYTLPYALNFEPKLNVSDLCPIDPESN